MKDVSVYSLKTLVNMVCGPDQTVCEIDGNIYPCRPLGYPSLRYRLRAAWLVLTGKGDVVIWPGNQ